ncbi:ZIP family metal transporter [Candidatus Woesearchaeota archaeon]|nr:ZIP family metal transporter [Candidatus Woesearchaeota archaeon]
MQTIYWIILSTLFVSLISLVGIFTLSLKSKSLEKVLMLFVALSAGALIGAAFFHLIPESLENTEPVPVFVILLLGFTFFFLIEKVLHWRHCHKDHCEIHTFAYMSLFGEAVHNFIDGLIIAASFVVDVKLGLITTLAIIAHEIPQEIGDFGVLVHGGFKKSKALLYNFLTALTAIIGGLVGYVLPNYIPNFTSLLLPFAAGGFLYISASDLIPELRKEKDFRKAMLNLLVFIIGIIIIYLTGLLE